MIGGRRGTIVQQLSAKLALNFKKENNIVNKKLMKKIGAGNLTIEENVEEGEEQIERKYADKTFANLSEKEQKIVYQILGKTPIKRSDQELQILQTIFKSMEFFQLQKKRLTPEKYLELFRQLRYDYVPQFAPVFYFGQLGCKFYIILEGEVSVLHPYNSQRVIQIPLAEVKPRIPILKKLQMPNEKIIERIYKEHVIVNKIQAGSSFGEIALTTSEGSRTATIVALKNCHFVTLSSDAYRKILHSTIQGIYHSMVKEQIEFLMNIKILKPIPETYLYSMLISCEKKTYQKNSIVYAEGDPVDFVYFIQEGSVQISRMVRLKNRDLIEEFESSADYMSVCDTIGEHKEILLLNSITRQKESKEGLSSVNVTTLGPAESFGEYEIVTGNLPYRVQQVRVLQQLSVLRLSKVVFLLNYNYATGNNLTHLNQIENEKKKYYTNVVDKNSAYIREQIETKNKLLKKLQQEGQLLVEQQKKQQSLQIQDENQQMVLSPKFKIKSEAITQKQEDSTERKIITYHLSRFPSSLTDDSFQRKIQKKSKKQHQDKRLIDQYCVSSFEITSSPSRHCNLLQSKAQEEEQKDHILKNMQDYQINDVISLPTSTSLTSQMVHNQQVTYFPDQPKPYINIHDSNNEYGIMSQSQQQSQILQIQTQNHQKLSQLNKSKSLPQIFIKRPAKTNKTCIQLPKDILDLGVTSPSRRVSIVQILEGPIDVDDLTKKSTEDSNSKQQQSNKKLNQMNQQKNKNTQQKINDKVNDSNEEFQIKQFETDLIKKGQALMAEDKIHKTLREKQINVPKFGITAKTILKKSILNLFNNDRSKFTDIQYFHATHKNPTQILEKKNGKSNSAFFKQSNDEMAIGTCQSQSTSARGHPGQLMQIYQSLNLHKLMPASEETKKAKEYIQMCEKHFQTKYAKKRNIDIKQYGKQYFQEDLITNDLIMQEEQQAKIADINNEYYAFNFRKQ